jgi:hypothetical protein
MPTTSMSGDMTLTDGGTMGTACDETGNYDNVDHFVIPDGTNVALLVAVVVRVKVVEIRGELNGAEGGFVGGASVQTDSFEYTSDGTDGYGWCGKSHYRGGGGSGGGGEIVVIEATTDGEKGTLTMTVTAIRLGLMGSMPTKESNTISRLMLSLNHSRRIVLALVVLKLKSMLSINVCTRKNGMFSLW